MIIYFRINREDCGNQECQAQVALCQMCSPGLSSSGCRPVQPSFHGNSHSPKGAAALSWSFLLRSKEAIVLGLKPLAQSVLCKTNIPAEKGSWITGQRPQTTNAINPLTDALNLSAVLLSHGRSPSCPLCVLLLHTLPFVYSTWFVAQGNIFPVLRGPSK